MSRLERIVAALSLVRGVLQSILFSVFLCLLSLMLAARLSANIIAVLAAGALGLVAGVALSKRLWFEKIAPPPKPAPAIEPWHLPGVQDEFERRLARQRPLAFLLISMLLAVLALRLAIDWHWPIPFGVTPVRLLVGALLMGAIIIPLGLLNWRCPNCRRNLGGTLWLRQCPKCGVVLRD